MPAHDKKEVGFLDGDVGWGVEGGGFSGGSHLVQSEKSTHNFHMIKKNASFRMFLNICNI